MPKPKIPLPKKAVFTAKPYSVAFLNSLFQKIKERPDPFLGTLLAESDQGLLILFILQSEVYAAGGWMEGTHKNLTLHEYFQTLNKMDKVQLSLYQTDPVYLKCLIGFIQKAPTTQATTDLVSIEGLLERLKQDAGENLLILKKDEEYNFFYFLKKRLVESYYVRVEEASKEDSLEEGLLSYVYTVGTSTPIELLLYSDLKVTHAPDADQASEGGGSFLIVDHFLQPCPHLVLIGPRDTLQKITLFKKVFTLGRSPENDLVLDDALVSRRHATLRKENESYILLDEKSRNGVLVNGQSISQTKLSDGDEIRIGGFKLKFLLGDQPEPVVQRVPVAGDETVVKTEKLFLDGKPKRQPRCWLEVASGPLQGYRCELSEVRTVIGRSQADVILKDPKASRHHAAIEWTDQGYLFIDLGSTNGSYINEERVKSQLIHSGDMIRIGGTTLKVTIEP